MTVRPNEKKSIRQNEKTFLRAFTSLKPILILFSFLMLTCSLPQAKPYFTDKSWKPEELTKLIPENRILDTNEFLEKESEDYKYIQESIQQIEETTEIKVFVFFINQMHHSYSKYFSSSKNIELFANELAFYLTDNNLEKDKYTLIVLFSVDDRQNRIRTGSETKKILLDSYAQKYLDGLKDQLRKELYTEALADLMEKIYNNVTGNNYLEILWEWITFIFAVLLVVGIIAASIYYYLEDRTIKSRLDRIKEITKNNVNKESFIDANCSICLEEFKTEELGELKQKQGKKESAEEGIKNCEKNKAENNNQNNNNEENDNIIKEDNTNFTLAENQIYPNNNVNSINEDLMDIDDAVLDNSEKEGLRERNTVKSNKNTKSEYENEENKKLKDKEEAKKDSFIAKLNCGHIFHSECIANWMTKKRTCPLCKKDLEDTGAPGSGSGSKGDIGSTQTNTNYTGQSTSSTLFGSDRMGFAEELVGIQTVFYPRISNYRMDYSGETFSYESTSGSSGSGGLAGFISSSGGASSKW